MPLETWVMQSGWTFLDHFQPEEYLDKMAEAGAGSLVFGAPLPVDPDLRNYHGVLNGCPSPTVATDREGGAIRALLQGAGERCMDIYTYGTNPHASGSSEMYDQLSSKQVLRLYGTLSRVKSYWGACANCPDFIPVHLGRIRDVHQNFPQVVGFLNDGPEYGYEIAPNFMDDNLNVFGCFGPCCENKALELGCDFKDMKGAALDPLRGLHALDAAAQLNA